ncbi:MAG: M28 family peptidase [Terriglobales bacterium]
MRTKPLALLLVLALFASAASVTLAAENTSAMPVTIAVTDPSGAVIPQAQIKISPALETNPPDMETGPDGKLTLALTPGTYDLSVIQPGFATWEQLIQVQWAPGQIIAAQLQVGSSAYTCGPCPGLPVEVALETRAATDDLISDPPTHFTGQSWWNHVKYLADDKLEGRDTGSRGERTAQKYAVKQLKKAGAQPAGENGFYQPVKFVKRQIVEKDSSLTLIRRGQSENGQSEDGRRESLVLGEDAIIGTRVMPAPEVSAPLVFVGYGLSIPEKNYDDLAGLDLHGKIAVYISGSPADIPGALSSHYQTMAERWRALRAAGAIGAISIPNPASMDIPWSRIALNRAHPSMDLDYSEFNETEGDQLGATINPASAGKIFAGSGHTFAEIAALGKERKPLPHFPLAVSLEAKTHVEVTKVESANIVAKLPGSDPAFKDEYVVLSAHLDHIGIGEPINGDRIYNGAMDNGSGSALVLDMAASFKQHPEKLRRSVLLVLVTGEEKGLLGSKYFAAHPSVPAKSMVADVNVDMFLPIVPLKILTVEGLDESDLGDRAREVAQSLGVKVQPDPEPQRNVFIRSDQYNFIRHGVPSIMMDVGAEPGSAEQKIFKDWLTQRYHAPSDDVNQPVDLEAAARYEEIVRGLLIKVADDPQPPRWKPQSFFRRYAGGN